MSYEYILEKYKRACNLIEGKFTERDFDSIVPAKNKGDEGGHTTMGKMSPQRKELIMSNALRRKLDIEEKFPQVIEDSKPKEKKETKPKEKKETKPKEKK